MGEKIDLAVPFGFSVVLCLNWCPTKDYPEFSVVAKDCQIRAYKNRDWSLDNALDMSVAVLNTLQDVVIVVMPMDQVSV